MFIGGEDIKMNPIGETPLQITAEDFQRIERNQKIIMAMIVALSLLILFKKK
jgi:small neutral amino acid transporter SnatA (MarC family)